jgi:hypothetical protein
MLARIPAPSLCVGCVNDRRMGDAEGGSLSGDVKETVIGMRLRVGLTLVAALAFALPASAVAVDRPHYVVPPGFTRCPTAKAAGGFFKWASEQRTTCHAAASFMADYAKAASDGPMPRRLHRYRCDIRYWRNGDGDIYASRHACRRGTVAIRFYGMV